MKRILTALQIVIAFLLVSGDATAQTAPVLRSSYASNPGVARVDWSDVPGVSWYQLRRTYTFPNNWYVFPGLIPSSNRVGAEFFNGAQNTVVYQVIPTDQNGVQIAPASNYAMVSKYTYGSSIVPGGPVLASHVTELRSVITNVRAAMGLAAPVWTQPSIVPGGDISHTDIEEMRSAINGIIALLNLAPPPYAQTAPLTGKPILSMDLPQMRDILRSYPEMIWLAASTPDPYFSPNGDGVKDTTTFHSTASWNNGSSRTTFRWQIFIRNAGNTVIRTATGTSPVTWPPGSNPQVVHDWIWDGRNDAGVVQPDGVYSYEIIDLDTVGGAMPYNWSSATATIDTVPPTASITSPANPYVLSNVRLSGGGSVTVTGSAADAIALATWKLERSGNSQATAQLGNGTTSVTNATLGTLSTITSNAPTIPNGGYQLTLTATDRAGNSGTGTSNVTVSHFTASQNVYQINAVGNQTVTYTSNVPFPVNETIEIHSATGQVVDTVFSGTRGAGAHQDIWDGRNASNQPAGDGPHYMVVTVTDGPYSMTWDPRATFVGNQSVTQLPYPECLVLGTSSWVPCDNSSLDFDPFKLKPLTFSYCVGSGGVSNCSASSMPAWVIGKVTAVAETDASCSPACIFTEFQPGGLQKFGWFGTATTGSYVAPYYPRLTVIRRHDQIPLNMVLVYGTTPQITDLQVTPIIFNPGAGTAAGGTQTFTVDVDTYNARQAQLKLQFRNMSTNSILRTLTTALAPEGELTAQWDGRADNNAWVAPGWYEVTITAIDSAGSTTKLRPIVVVRY